MELFRVLGIDPGLEQTGYGLIEMNSEKTPHLKAHGVFKSSRRQPLQERLAILYEQLSNFLAERCPSVVVLEELYSHYEHPVTAILMGHARAMTCLVAAQGKIPLVSYAATRIKKAITGNGGASKEQVHRMVCHLLAVGDLSGPWDVTDALALAVAHVHMSRSIRMRDSMAERPCPRVRRLKRGFRPRLPSCGQGGLFEPYNINHDFTTLRNFKREKGNQFTH